ncbi:hypothetical protein JMJ35_003742 [Cladonia borealis]|uniref:HD/PDEase domain-containing protein n=1 Tax=Cladonia borealis TaxID=184061 RepID=A0AA39V8Z8_9LECA|nr:hypothetical protein JMJ35_003742 [Cladonia borealis]
MSRFDASHDYKHILRVYYLARTISAREADLVPPAHYNPTLIALASLLHDVGDKKYLMPGEDGSTMVQNILLEFGADVSLAKKVQEIVSHVSYSTEIENPSKIQEFITVNPELAVVQDADRLDAIGAVGIGRCFAYTAAKGKGSLQEAIAHFQEKLERLKLMMKTRTGKAMAVERTERLRVFRAWWDEEVDEGRQGWEEQERVSG